MTGPPYDILYTWVDDSFPGFLEERARYATNPEDVNPERTRDNLDLLKYSLRSVERYAPWRGKIWIVTCRPQVPRWLISEHPNVRIVYLDEFMPADELPSFNAFAIESYVHRIPGLSQRYVHFNDDMLLTRQVETTHFLSDSGRLQYYFNKSLPNVRKANMTPHASGRVNVALALEKTFGPGRYPQQAHHPRIIDKGDMERLVDIYPEEFARTRAARFRGHETILPHILLAAHSVKEGRADLNGPRQTRHVTGRVNLVNSASLNRLRLTWALARPSHFLCLNDDFGPRANPSVEEALRRFLCRISPDPSSYEH